MFPVIEIFGRTVGTYGLCALAGVAAAFLFLYFRVKKDKVQIEDVILMTLCILAGVLIGGHLLYAVTRWEDLLTVFSGLFQKSFRETALGLADVFGGSVFYGGLLGSLLSLAVYLKYAKIPGEQKVLLRDTYAVAVPLFHAFGRIGCFLGGCCYGVESEFGWIVKGNEWVPGINGVRRFPVALVEAAFNLILFFVLWQLSKSKKTKGWMTILYCLSYPVGRFILEFFRGDGIRGFLWGLSTSQWISIVIFSAALTVLIVKTLNRPEDGTNKTVVITESEESHD